MKLDISGSKLNINKHKQRTMYSFPYLPSLFHHRQMEPSGEWADSVSGLCSAVWCQSSSSSSEQNQRKHGHVFTCRLMGNYVHFITNPLSYHKVLCHGKYFDWKRISLYCFCKGNQICIYITLDLFLFSTFSMSIYLIILMYSNLKTDMLKATLT